MDFLFIPVVRNFVYTSLFVYMIHQRPRGGERLAGRYNAEEHLRRLLRARRCAGRVRSVGTSREGRRSSRCRAAGSGFSFKFCKLLCFGYIFLTLFFIWIGQQTYGFFEIRCETGNNACLFVKMDVLVISARLEWVDLDIL